MARGQHEGEARGAGDDDEARRRGVLRQIDRPTHGEGEDIGTHAAIIAARLGDNEAETERIVDATVGIGQSEWGSQIVAPGRAVHAM